MSDPLDQDHTFPSTVVERYLARSAHGPGMVFDARFRFACYIDPRSLATAWMRTLSLHPRLHAKLTGRGKAQHWSIQTVVADRFFFESSIDVDESTPNNATPNIREGRGAVLIVDAQAADTRLRFRFHHSACDGVGAARIIGDFFKGLTNQSDRAATASENSETANVATSSTSTPPVTIPAITPDLRNSWATIRGRNVRLSKHITASKRSVAETPSLKRINHHTLAFEFDEQRSQVLRRWLREQKIPLNDFAVAAALHGLAHQSQHHAANRMHVMIMNPVQVRSYRQRRSSSNHIGFAFIRRRHDDLGVSGPESVEPVVTSVHQELRHVRDQGIAGELSWGIGLLESVPLSLRGIERLGWFTPTASVTCLSSIRFARRYGLAFDDQHTVTHQSETPDTADRSTVPLRLQVTDVALGGPLQSGGELSITVWDLGGCIGWSFRLAKITDVTTAAATELAELLCQFADRSCSLSLQSRLTK